jgi:hypothetical protein
VNGEGPTFTAVSGTDWYWLDGAEQTAGFLASPHAQLGPTITLAQSWTDTAGVYAFTGVAPADAATFASALRDYVVDRGWPNGPRFAWIADPNVPATGWSGQTLDLRPSGNTYVVARGADFALTSYVLSVSAGAEIAPTTGTPGWGFACTQSAYAPLTLFSPSAPFPCTGGAALLSLETAGAWQAAFSLPAATNDGPSGLDQLGAGLRWFTTDADGYIGALRTRALVQPPQALWLGARVDPLRPLVPARTAFSFVPASGTPPTFASGYATARGYEITLTATAANGSVPDAGLAFAFHPIADGPGEVPGEYYLVPQGAFAMTVVPPDDVPAPADDEPQRLLCGDSGLEYVGIATTGATLQFVPGRPAFAPISPHDGPALTPLGTTSWCWVGAANPVQYFAQPQDAPLYAAADATTFDDEGGFLNFLEVPTVTLPPPDGVRAFPLSPYRGVAPESVRLALELESRALAPARRAAILVQTQSAWSTGPAAGDAAHVGVTPQGLAAGISADYSTWTWLGIANQNGTAEPDLRFTNVHGLFRQAMQTNRLFLVLGNPDVVLENADVQYQLTPLSFGIIATLPEGEGVPPAVLTAVQTAFADDGYPVYDTEDAFDAALVAAYAAITDEEILVFERQAGLLTPVIDGWRFQLSPRNWLSPTRSSHKNAFVVFKFALGASFVDLVGDTTRWAWAEASSPNGSTAAQHEIQSIVTAAIEAEAKAVAANTTSPYHTFVQNVRDPNWTGIIALSVDVPLETLPEPLQMLAAGIDPSAFYAHHVGFNVTPFSAGTSGLTFRKTSMFGLIDYQNLEDQYFEEDIAYAFRVMQLTTLFTNSAVSGFTSQVELLVNRLFGAPPILYPTDRGNNVLLDGVFQRQRQPDGTEQETYVFGLNRNGTFRFQNDRALRAFEVLSLQLVTSKAASLRDESAIVESRFVFAGNLQFYDPEKFDLFSFGAPHGADDASLPDAERSRLRCSGLTITMRFALGDPAGTTTFTVNENDIAFDLVNSVARPNSLLAKFPVTLTGFIAQAADDAAHSPQGLGYVSVSAPLEQSRMSSPWYGLVYTVELGDLGALAASVNLTMRVLAAWSGGGTEATPAMFLGVRLPGVEDAVGVRLPLQGVLDLGFRAVQFHAREEGGEREYSLRLRDFALRFLGMAFPPGNNDVYLFGNPDPASNTKLGWYAAYAKKPEKKKGSGAPARAAIRGARLQRARALPPERR